jgi:hypothetical protein
MWQSLANFWRRHRARYSAAVERYGIIFLLWANVLRILMAATVVVAVQSGFAIPGFTATTGIFAAAWVFVWPFAPLRWALAAALAPPTSRLVRRLRGLNPDLPPVEDLPPDPPATPPR